jgi:hypothetical protein
MTTLRNVLIINSASSGVTGLILMIVPGFIAGLFETSNTQPFTAVGIFLVAFAFLVLRASLQKPLRFALVWFIIALDSLWILTSVSVITLHPFDISTLGYVFIAAVAAWVMLMVYLQFNGIRQLAVDKKQGQ